MTLSLSPEAIGMRDFLSAVVNTSAWVGVFGVVDKRVVQLGDWSARFFDALALQGTRAAFTSFFEKKDSWGDRINTTCSLAGNVCDILDLAATQIGIIHLGQRLTLIRVASLVSGLMGDILSLVKEASFAYENEDSGLTTQLKADGTREIVVGGSSAVTVRGRFWAAVAKIICSIAWTILAIAALLTGVSTPQLSMVTSTMSLVAKVYLCHIESRIK
jgi:hypothetical protein